MGSGLNLKRYFLSAFAALFILLINLFPCAAADDPANTDVVKLLPKNGDVGKWEICPETLAYAAGDDLTRIYNGGYQLYTKNGVLDAAQQMYLLGSDSVMVTVHTMTSADSAFKFYKYWKKSAIKQKTLKVVKVPGEGFIYIAGGAGNAYLYRDKYFVTVSAYIPGEKGRTAASIFMKKLSASIGVLVTPKK
ncbi:MAG: hypothetical protein ACYC27_06525 [Armatimonadota bacterium]